MRAVTVAVFVMIGATGIARADPPWIKAEAIVDTVDAALATVDAKAPKGLGTVVAMIEKPTVPVNAKTLRDAFVARQLTVVDDFASGGNIVLTVEGKTGARATISVAAEQGTISMIARPAKTKPPGPCVAIPFAIHDVLVNSNGVNDSGESFDGQIEFKLETVRTFDFDGDGITDALVPVAKDKNTCPDEMSWRAFIVRGSCAHELGVIGPGWLAPTAITVPLDASGFRPVTMASETIGGNGRIPEVKRTTTSFAVTKGRYAKTGAKSSTGLCHHCGRNWCHAP